MQPPKKLYKYVPPDRVDILRNGLIRFTQPSSLNDPFEMQPVFETLFPEEEVEEILKLTFEDVEEALRRNYQDLPTEVRSKISEDQLIQLVQSNPEILKNILSNIGPSMRSFLRIFPPEAKAMIADGINKNIGLLSLSETADNVLMWSHYAASHKGFVIEFDASDDFFDRKRSGLDEFYHLRKVAYIDRNASGRTLRDLSGNDVLVTKMLDWEYEEEWRMLMPLMDSTEIIRDESGDIHLFAIPLSTVSGVIFGAKMSEEVEHSIKELIRQADKDITVRRASISSATQCIEIN